MNVVTIETERNAMLNLIAPVRHGLLLAVAAMILGISWAAYLATHHEQLHGGFEKQEAQIQADRLQRQMRDMNMNGASSNAVSELLIPRAHAHGAHATRPGNHQEAKHQHSHTGSLAMDAMQRLMRGHIHWMGLGILSTVLLLVTAFTSLKAVWKKALGWSFGLGALAYPIAWIVMGFRTVVMGPEVAEASIMWLFVPAAGLLLASIGAVFGALLLEMRGWHAGPVFSRFFEPLAATGA